jgi:hypothetical protein
MLRRRHEISGLIVAVAMLFFVPESVFAGNDGTNPYAVIAERNVFGLQAPPTPQPAVVKSPELPLVNLSGFVTIGDKTQAFLVIHPKDSEAPRGSRNCSPGLAEGEKWGSVELVRMDEAAELVEILNAGIPMTLTMKANGNGSGGDFGRGQTASLSGPQALGALPQSASPIATPFNPQTPGGNYARSGPIIVGGAQVGAVSAVSAVNPGRSMAGAVRGASQPSYQDPVANGPSAASYNDGAVSNADPSGDLPRAQNPRVYAVTKYGYPPGL